MSHVSTRPGPSPVERPPRPRLRRVPYRAGILIGVRTHRAGNACPGQRSRQGLSPDSSLGPGLPGHPRGRGLRTVWAQRRREDDLPPGPLRPHASDRRTSDRVRSRRADPTERSAQAARDPLRPPYALRGHDGPRLPRVLCANVRDPAGSGPRACRGGDARPRADATRGSPDREAVDGRAATHGARAGPPAARPGALLGRAVLEHRREHADRAAHDFTELGGSWRGLPFFQPEPPPEGGVAGSRSVYTFRFARGTAEV